MANSLKTHRFSVRLSENEVKSLCQIAHREGFSSSAVVRHLIIRFIESRHALGGVNEHVAA
jgi:metal-responsive CopG/Arc/MetJ family transcriptional regulator